MAHPKLLQAFLLSSLSMACAKQGAAPEPESAAEPTIAEAPLAEPVVDEPVTANPAGRPPGELAPNPDPTTASPTPLEPEPVAPVLDPTPAAEKLPALTDAQIVKITDTVDTGEIRQAKLVQQKSKSARVKQFAAHMITTHVKAKQKANALTQQEKLTPQESPVSIELSQKTAQQLAAIGDADDASVDRTYIDAQVEQHQVVLDLLTVQLIPSAADADLKAQLEETRSMVEAHLKEAKDIQQTLSGAVLSSAPEAPAL